MNTNENMPSALISRLVSTLDLDAYEDTTTGTLVLVDPSTQAPTSSTITLAGPEHQSRKQLDLARTRKLRAAVSSTGKMPISDPVDDYDDETDYFVAATLGWNLTRSGQPVPFSPDTARAIYTDPKRQWVREQVKAGLGKTALFIKTSAKA